MRQLRRLFAVLLLASTVGAGHAGPVEDLSGIVSSPNVHLVATIPDTGATGGRFAGGYFFTTISGTEPFVPNPNGGLRIYDVSNPEIPVLAGTLPLPHSQNEDVDVSVSRKLVLISQDNFPTNGILFVISWENVHAPVLLSVLAYPDSVVDEEGKSWAGPGHIANCVDADCRWVYVTGAGGGILQIIDLNDPANPTLAGEVPRAVNPAGNKGVTRGGFLHDVNVDPDGNVWTTGTGGTAMLDTTDPLHPTPTYWTTPEDNAAQNQFIHHGSLRMDDQTLLVTEEDIRSGCGPTGAEQGSFQTWGIPAEPGTLTFLDSWVTELGSIDEGTAPFIDYCSAHWFDFNSRKVVAIGWYNQGVRFLDVSDPSDIRQVGYFIGPAAMASHALFAPGRDDVVYVADYQRGTDILKIDNGGAETKTTRAPLPLRRAAPRLDLAPDPRFGYACLVGPA